MKKISFFLGLDDTCGYYSQLEKGLQLIGQSCTFVNAYPNRTYKRFHKTSFLGQCIEWIAVKRVNTNRRSLLRFFWSILEASLLPFLFISSLFKYNVFIFSGGTSFFAPYDLWLLKLLRKKIIIIFHGSDSRAPYSSAVCVGTEGQFEIKKCIHQTKLIKKHILMIERYADIIINNPASAQLHEKQFINWHYIGIPYDCFSALKIPAKNFLENEYSIIVHAPTRPEYKGSSIIENAINLLIQEGYKIKFIKLVNKSNVEVLDELNKCDFIVDELFSDVIMAKFATEAAGHCKPAIVGILEYQKIESTIKTKEMIPPVLHCSSDTIKEAIEKLIIDREYRLKLGTDARRFVETQWNPTKVAQRILQLAKNEYPLEWLYDPKEIDRLHGWGLTDKRAREVIRKIIKFAGLPALQLSNNPQLEKKYLEFATRAE